MAISDTADLDSQGGVEQNRPPVFGTIADRESVRLPQTRNAHVAPYELLAPRLGRDRIGLLLTESVGIPVHAILAPNTPAPQAVLALLRRATQGQALVTFANPATVSLARRSRSFCRDLNVFDLVLPDGIGMCLALRLLHGLPARRVSFDMTSLAPAVFEHARQFGLSVVLVGGAPGVAEGARDQLTAGFPGLIVTGVFDGFGNVQATVREVVALRPDILICGMGGAAQEAFLLKARAQGWRGLGFTCGGFLDQLQGRLQYYPRWIDRLNLRWAYRLAREPGRLWRRYLIDYSWFAVALCASRVRR